MNNNTTNKKKLELKKTAIANLTLSEVQMRVLVGGNNLATKPTESCKCNLSLLDDGGGCGTRPTRITD